MKLNADVGECAGNDAALFQWIGMANIACGYHAGDLGMMAATVQLAVRYGVAVGAHPGYRDREGFGRRSIAHLPGEIKSLVIEQAEALEEICQQEGARVSYVKPHGALYHDMMSREDIFEEILQAVATLPHCPALMIQARRENANDQKLAERHGVALLFEAFADRAYTAEGELQDRAIEGAVFASEEQMIAQVVQLRDQGTVTTTTGEILPLKADSVCVHGDNEASIEAAKQLYQILRG